MTIKAAYANPDPDTPRKVLLTESVCAGTDLNFLTIKSISNVEPDLLELFLYMQLSKTTQRAPFRIYFTVEQGHPVLVL